MKLNKILICLICFLINISGVSAAEIQYLYVIKNIPKENLANIVDNYLLQGNYKVVSKNDFYVLPYSQKNNEFYEILLEQNGSNCYMYYLSNNSSIGLNNLLIQEFKKGHLGTKQVNMPEISNTFAQKAISLKKESENVLSKAQNYDFGDDAQLVYDEKNGIPLNPSLNIQQKTQVSFNHKESNTMQKTKTNNYIPLYSNTSKQNQTIKAVSHPEQISKSNTLKGSVMTVASGTAFNATLESAVSSASLSESDKITAVLNDDFTYNGQIIFPKDTILYGTAAKASSATYGYGNGSLELVFNQALTPNGNKINISVDKISYVKKSERALNITKNVAVGTGLGILGGLVSAACTGNYGQALLVGASIGAASGGIYAAAQKGEEIEIPEGTILNLKINQAINISPYN